MALSQCTRGIRACHCHPWLTNPREKLALVSLSGVFTFVCPIPHVFSQLIFQLNCYFVAGIDGPLSVYKGIRARHCHPWLANPGEKLMTVSLSGVFTFFPPVPHVFSPLIFQLNCYFVAGIDGPLSVYKGNKSLPLPSSACKSQREAGNGKFVWCIHFLPLHSPCFLAVDFSIKLLFCCRHQRPSLSVHGE